MAGRIYQALLRRISSAFCVRPKQPRIVFMQIQQYLDTDACMRVVGCQRLDVSALEDGKAMEHLELLATLRELLEVALEQRAGGGGANLTKAPTPAIAAAPVSGLPKMPGPPTVVW